MSTRNGTFSIFLYAYACVYAYVTPVHTCISYFSYAYAYACAYAYVKMCEPALSKQVLNYSFINQN